jgi:polysaccharide deacetylase 2 family uncharacterized protein YibQ
MGYGMNHALTQKAMELPQNIAISLSPYSPEFNDWALEAKSGGHELLVDLPAETSSYPLEDPGPLAVLNESSEAKQLARIRTLLEACKSCLGAVLPPQENIAQSQETMRPVMEALQKSNVTLVYNEKPTTSYLMQEARAIGLSTISHYVILDDVPSKDAIDAKLETVRKLIMEQQKTVVAVGQPYPVTLERVQSWGSSIAFCVRAWFIPYPIRIIPTLALPSYITGLATAAAASACFAPSSKGEVSSGLALSFARMVISPVSTAMINRLPSSTAYLPRL